VSFLGDVRNLSAVTYTGRDRDQRHPVGDVAVAAELAEMVGLEHHVVQYDGGEVLAAMRRSVCDADGEAGFVEQSIWDRLRDELGYEYVIIGDECLGLTAGRIHESQVLDCVAVRALGDVRTLWPYVRSDRFDELAELSDRSCRELQAPWLGRPPVNQVDELWHRQGMGRWFNPKRRLLARYGLIARRPLLDRDVLDLLRSVPYRYRCGRMLARKAIVRVNPAMTKLPLARGEEAGDYRGHLREMEEGGGEVSAFLFDDNPLAERYLNEEAVRALVARVTAQPSTPVKRRRMRLIDVLPPGLRAWLVARARRYLKAKAPALTGQTDQLLRIILAAECLRYVHRRCGTA
jgi:asparagine synthetase B (glutamine-hydrolysing)